MCFSFGSEINFFLVTFSVDFEVLLSFPRAMTFTYDCPAERVVCYRLVLCQGLCHVCDKFDLLTTCRVCRFLHLENCCPLLCSVAIMLYLAAH